MNHKFTLSLFGLGLAAAAAAITAAAPWQALRAPRSSEAAESITFYGTMERNNTWTDSQKVGFYSFTSDGAADEFSSYRIFSTNRLVTGGGAYYDGYFYYIHGTDTSIKDNISNTFNKVDVHTWETVSVSGHNAPTLTDAYAMAYDYSTSTMYAYCPDREEGGYSIRTVDLETGKFTDVAKVDKPLFMPAIAFSAEGEMYGVSHPNNQTNSCLYKIDKHTGKSTLVGDIGYLVNSTFSGGTFDYRTGKLYWALVCYTVNQYQERFYTSCIMEIDPATGKATPVKEFLNKEVFSTLFFMDSHPKAPEAVSNMTVKYADGSDNVVTLDFDVPSRHYDRSAMSGEVKVEVYVDGILNHTLTGLGAGSRAVTNPITLADGTHEVTFYCYDSLGRKSVRADINVWGGRDVPGKVGNLTVTTTPRGETATVTWTAPEGSKAGGNYDPEDITYKVVRRPEGTVVAEGLTETTFTDTPSRRMMLSQYEVYAVTKVGSSDVAYTTPILVGAEVKPPYLETFDTQTMFNTFTIIDVNGISHYDGDRWMWFAANREAIYGIDYATYPTPADAWIITPTIGLVPDNVYRLSFSTRGYSTGDHFEFRLSAHVGDMPTVEGQKREIMRVVNEHSKENINYYGFFTADEGDCRVGFHLVSPGTDHRGLDNIRVAYYGPSTIPAEPELVSKAVVDGAVKLTIKVPSVDTRGREIASLTNVRLFRNGNILPISNVTEGVAPGATLVLNDANPVFGINEYIITASSDQGQGLELKVSVDTKAPAPVAVESVAVRTLNNDRDVEISWSYPEGCPSATGEELDPSEISYNIYRTVGGVRSVVAQDVHGNSFTDKLVTEYFPNERQKYVDYYVAATTTGGVAAEKTARIIVGQAYELPLEESDFYNLKTTPWLSEPTTAWSPATNGYEPKATPFTGITFMRCYGNGDARSWVSPRLNLSSLVNQKLSFRLFCQNSALAASAGIEIGIIYDVDGVQQPVKIISPYYSCKDEDGWKLIELDMSDYSSYSRASIAFVAHAVNNFWVYIDDIRLTGERLAHDLALESLTGPAQAVRGRDNVYNATVRNCGTEALAGKVTFAVGGQEVSGEDVNIAAGESATVECIWVPELNGPEESVEMVAAVASADDQNPYNDKASMIIGTVYPNVPYVNDLVAVPSEDGLGVQLSWGEASTYPGAEAVKDDFESYDDFTISDFGQWTMVDKDGAKTMMGMNNGVTSFTWENCGKEQAFIVFNAVKVGVSEIASAYSGSKCLIAFSAATENDDWLISPQLLGQSQTISFYVRAMLAYYSPETYEIWISRSGRDIEDFTLLAEESVSNETWLRKSYELPDGARYFAIRCTSQQKWALMIDDIEYIPAQPAVNLYGYNVYRNGENIADCIGETEYLDPAVDATADHTYHVSAVYDDGESIFSNPAVINLSGIDGVAHGTLSVKAADGRITIEGAEGMVCIYTVDGRMMYNFRATGSDSIAVVPGVYIVLANNSSYKLLVK
ncbi:MAG: choice-of-anchor J domain-containing protein [Muribaculaceae bacterium]|nr:choice-of-anchor J domain-containing protein [Muribaculaceae bacterium]